MQRTVLTSTFYYFKTQLNGSEYWWACDANEPMEGVYLVAVHACANDRRQKAPATSFGKRGLEMNAGARMSVEYRK